MQTVLFKVWFDANSKQFAIIQGLQFQKGIFRKMSNYHTHHIIVVNEEELAEEEEDVLCINSCMRSGCRDSLVSPLQTGSYLFLFTVYCPQHAYAHVQTCGHDGAHMFADARCLRQQREAHLFWWNHHPFLTNWWVTWVNNVAPHEYSDKKKACFLGTESRLKELEGV